jgi:hypothetical protein
MANCEPQPPKPQTPPREGYEWVCVSVDSGYEYWWEWVQRPKEPTP